MGQEPDGVCGYIWPENDTQRDEPTQQSGCCRNSLSDTDRCAWHADPEDTDEKTIKTLQDARVDGETRRQTKFVGELLDGAILPDFELTDTISLNGISLRDAKFTNANLNGINFENSNLNGANLEGANLTDARLGNCDLSNTSVQYADLTNSDLQIADFTDSNLQNADLIDAKCNRADFNNAILLNTDFTNANLIRADFTDSTLLGADLVNADLRNSDLIETNLQATDLSGIDFRDGTIHTVDVNGATKCGKQTRAEREAETDRDWDAIARSYHSLKTTFSEAGLIGKARNHHYLERRARGFEAKESFDLLSWYASGILKYFIGYGVRVQTLLRWMVVLFIISTSVYAYTGIEEKIIQNVSYSVLAFTVAPPYVPDNPSVQIVMIIETFFGTLSIVLLGYVLGNREHF